MSGRNIQTLQDTASKCDKDTMIKPVDISDKQSVRDLICFKSEIEHIDVLLNCAGINIKRDWDHIDENEWDQVIQTNINGLFYCCKAVIPFMKDKMG